jgi:hypothetical protein
LHKIKKIVSKKQLQESALAGVALEGILEKKGRGVVQLDLRYITDRPADIFLIAEAESGVRSGPSPTLLPIGFGNFYKSDHSAWKAKSTGNGF